MDTGVKNYETIPEYFMGPGKYSRKKQIRYAEAKLNFLDKLTKVKEEIKKENPSLISNVRLIDIFEIYAKTSNVELKSLIKDMLGA
ncbi:MAG: hypothetical protein ABIH00_09475 [Armatimonadota bacterium]